MSLYDIKESNDYKVFVAGLNLTTNPTIGYVLTCANSEGKAVWQATQGGGDTVSTITAGDASITIGGTTANTTITGSGNFTGHAISGNMGLSATGGVSVDTLTASSKIITPALKDTTSPAVGKVLISDGSGNATWGNFVPVTGSNYFYGDSVTAQSLNTTPQNLVINPSAYASNGWSISGNTLICPVSGVYNISCIMQVISNNGAPELSVTKNSVMAYSISASSTQFPSSYPFQVSFSILLPLVAGNIVAFMAQDPNGNSSSTSLLVNGSSALFQIYRIA